MGCRKGRKARETMCRKFDLQLPSRIRVERFRHKLQVKTSSAYQNAKVFFETLTRRVQPIVDNSHLPYLNQKLTQFVLKYRQWGLHVLIIF